MAEDKQDKIQQYLRNYIKKNRDIYTPDIIRFKLLEAGYDHHDIREAFEALGIDEQQETHRKDDWRSASVNPIGFLIFFPLIPVVTYVTALYQPGWASLAYLATLIAGFLVPNRIKHRDPSMAKGMIYGFRTFLVLFVILPIIAAVVLFGICVVSLMSYSSY